MLHLKNFFAGLRPTGIMAVNNVMFLFFVGGAQALKAAGGGRIVTERSISLRLGSGTKKWKSSGTKKWKMIKIVFSLFVSSYERGQKREQWRD